MASVNSASEAGGLPAEPHLRVAPQLPVSHDSLLFRSKLQPVRAQMRPDQATGAVNTMVWPGFKTKPPPLKYSPGVTAGQIVSLQ